MEPWIAGAIFVATYAFIATDRLDKTLAALLGGVLVVIFQIIDQEKAFEAIDFNVIFLLAGMMILAGVLRQTGFFQWIAIRSVKIARGDPFRLLVILSIVCAVLSAFLDNVTTVVLLAPVTLYIANTLRISPMPFLISEILASNIGGTATLIGDPPNILIGSAAGLDFLAFLNNLAPVAIVTMVVFLITLRFMFGRQLHVEDEVRQRVLGLDENEVIADRRLLNLSLLVITLTLLGFLLARPLHYEVATIALLGATILMVIARLEPEEILREVEWPTLLFFVGLFMLVEAVVEVGIIAAVGNALFDLTGGDQAVTTIGLLWLSGVASGIVDNIPYTATMIPLVRQLGAAGLDMEPLWWSLALGADMGGNATIIGASANVVVANLAARSGHPITFRAFLPYGVLIVAQSLVIGSVYLWLRYLM